MKQFYVLFAPLLFFFTLPALSGTVSVFDIDPPVIIGPSTLCGPGNVTLNATAVPSAQISWYDAETDGNLLSTGPSFSVNPLSVTTTYYAEATLDDETSTRTSFTVTVADPPVINDVDFVDNQCSGLDILFSPDISNGTAPFTYSWNFDDGVTSTETTPSHPFNSIGCGTQVFDVTLTVTDANGCSATYTTPVTIKQKPDVAIEDQNVFSPFSNCDNSPSQGSSNYTITIDNISQNTCANNYSIDWGDGNTETNLAFTDFPLDHTYTQLGSFNLAVTAFGANGCNNTQVYVVANQSNPAGSLGTLGSTTGLCAPAIVPFTIGNWELNSPGTTYILDFGDETSVTLNHPLTETTIYHSYAATSCPNGSYTATLTVTNACDSTPYTAGNVQVRINPTAQFTGPARACINENVCFTNTTLQGTFGASCNELTTYTWNFGDPSSPNNEVVVNSTGIPNQCHTFSAPGIYTVTLTTANPCGDSNYTQTICIESPLAPDFTLNTIEGCAPLLIETTNITDESNSCNVIYNWSATFVPEECDSNAAPEWVFANGTTADSDEADFTFNAAGTYTIRLIATNICGSEQITKTVTVIRPPTVTIDPIDDLCGATEVTITPTVTLTECNGGAPTYLWNFPGGTPSTSTDEAPSVTYTTSGSHTFSVEVTNACGTVSDSESIIIGPIVFAEAGDDVTICPGSTTLEGTATGGSGSGYTYSWSPTTGLTGANTATPQASPTSTTTYTLTVTDSNGCTATDEVTVFVNELNQGAIAASQTICNGGDPVVFTEVTPATAQGTISYQWESSVTSNITGYTDIAGATDATYDPPIATQNTWYRRKVTSTLNGVECTATTNFVEIIINNVYEGIIEDDQTICTGGDPNPIIVSIPATGQGALTYQWQSSTDNITFTDIAGATADTYNPGVLTATTYYRRVVTSTSNGVACTAVGNTVTITVEPDPVIDVQPLATQSLCQNAPATTLEVTASGGIGTFNYQWYSNTANDNTSGTPVTGATAATFTPPTDIAGTLYYYCVVSQTGLGCTVTSQTAEVNIIAAPVFSEQPLSSDVCLNGTPNTLSVAYTNGTGTPTYQWYSNTVDDSTTGTEIAGATSPTYIPSTTTEGTTYYYCVITFPVGGCSLITSDTAEVNVRAIPAITVQPTETQSLCVGGTASELSVAYDSDGGNATYQWYSNTTNSNTGGTIIAGADQANYTPSAFTAEGTYYYYVTIDFENNGCGNLTSEVAEVIVVQDPIVTQQPLATQSLCQSPFAQDLTVTATGGVGLLSYQWYSNTTNNNTGGTEIAGATADTYSPPATTVGTTYYYCIITAEGSGCNVTSDTAEVIVNPSPIVSTQPQSEDLCLGQPISELNVDYTNGTGTPTYQWYSNTVNDTTTGTPIAGATSATYQPTDTNPGTLYYYCEIVFPIEGCSVILSETAAISIYALPSVNDINEETCSNETFTVIPTDGNGNNVPANTMYTWTAPAGTGFTGGSAQATPQSEISQTLTNTTNAPVTATYTVTPVVNNCNGETFTVVITLYPAATLEDGELLVCSGSDFSYDPATNAVILPAGTVYQWDVPVVTSGITGGASGSGELVVTGNLTNPTTTNQTATYTVTPVSPEGNCLGEPFNLVVTVSSEFAVTSDVSDYNGFQISTSGATDGWINLTPTGGSGTYTYSWTGPDGFTADTQNIENLGEGTYTVIISDGLCNDIELTILINAPLPLTIGEADASHVDVSCFGASTGVIEVEITQVSIAPFDYVLMLEDGTVIETVEDTFAENYVFDNLPAGNYTVQVTDANGTAKTIEDIIITQPESGIAITEAVVSDFNGFGISCFGNQDGSIDLTVEGGYPGYTYNWTGPNGFTADTQDISNLNPGTYTVVINDTTGACPVTESYEITEPQPIAYTSTVSNYNGFNVSCFGGNNGAISIFPTGGNSDYVYQWTGPNGFTSNEQNLTGLFAGSYELTLTDTNNCSATGSTYTLTEPEEIIITETHVNVICFGDATGEIDVTVTGGVLIAGYLYNWTGPNGFTSANEDLIGITAGAYTLTITDDLGCNETITVTITEQPEIIIIPTTTPITCYGADNASISLAISGGNPPYTAQWSNLATGTFQDNLGAGTYTITVTDESNCTKTIAVVIDEAPVFTVNPVYTNITCHGANDGSIALNLIGGIAPVTLTWSDGSTAGTTRNNLGPGTYTATIVDGTPCEIVRTFTIVEPAALTLNANITHATDCDDTMSGAIDLLVAGGTPPYTYDWSNGESTQDLTNITSGNYFVEVTDANGCTNSATYSITRPEPITLEITTDIVFDCDTQYVRQVNIAHASGGVPPFQYTWTSGEVSGQNGQYMSTDQNGTVIVTATDFMGCTATQTFEVDTQQLGEAFFTAESYAHTTYNIYSIMDPVTFINESTGDYTEVSWDFGDGSFSSELDPTHTYVREGTYTVTLTVVYPYGCTDTYSIVLEITKGYEVMIPNAFTPNADGVNDTFSALYKGFKSIELNVYDTWGSLIYSEKGEVIRGWNGYIQDVPSENGNYYYRINAETFYGQFVNFEGPFVLIK
ncbi:PKD domain-containing protein [Flavobacterium alkalisoli]|uniref:PKD domain-containing protein n=1 Tax=Flavobacterium alkalisoli TaxID=2602769 RepID=A0A5B9FR43_9FLAO|nr:PKD domain-containing protein [Flavobacterium alkalisoli]QEE49813.1 PKD domain-containing protein [Flavobacterium alkalisoli]